MYRSVFFYLHTFNFLCLSYFLLFSLSANSQDIFQKTIGTNLDDSGSLFKTKDGYHLIGYTNINGSDDMYIVQLNTDFEVIWSKAIGSSGVERAVELIQKPNGNLIISGTGKSGSSTILMEITSDGNLINVTGFGSFHDRLQKIILTNDGGHLNYGELEGLVTGHNKVSVIKYDSLNNIEWRKFYNHSTSSDSESGHEMYARQAIQLNDSSYILLASYTKMNDGSNSRKIRIIKIDKDGNEEWVKGFHGGKMDNAFHMILCNDGGYMISATSNSYTSGYTDLLLIKTNENGEQQWLKTYGGNRNELAGQILQLPNGNFMVSGSTNSFGSDDLDFLLFEIDPNGSIIKAHTYGGNRDDILVKLDTTIDFYCLSGSSNSYNHGDKDILIVRTAFNDVSNECGLDVTSFINAETNTTTFTSDHYTQGDFVSPYDISITSSIITSTEKEQCSTCRSGETKILKLCPGDSILIDYRDINPISVIWQDGLTQVFRYLKTEGIYWIDVETIECSFRDSIIVEIEQIYNLDLGEDQFICFGDTLDLNATIPNALGYEWQDETTDPIFRATKPGEYKVIVDMSCGAITDSIHILPPNSDNIFIPNVITPDNDEWNNFFIIKGTDFEVRLTVFNRWGEEVYKSDSYNNDWNGQNLSSGIYYYFINIDCINKDYKGWLKIIKE